MSTQEPDLIARQEFIEWLSSIGESVEALNESSFRLGLVWDTSRQVQVQLPDEIWIAVWESLSDTPSDWSLEERFAILHAQMDEAIYSNRGVPAEITMDEWGFSEVPKQGRVEYL